MPTVAVVLHKKKVAPKARGKLRRSLSDAGFPDPLWYEVPKSRKARKKVKKAVKKGADLVIAWGGDGTVQRCLDGVAGRDVALAVIPAGTSNLLARALRIPAKPQDALKVALDGDRRTLDTGTVNGEHFAVVAGAGLDALLVRDANSGLKAAVGRVAYVWTGLQHVDMDPFEVQVEVDGDTVFQGKSTSVLVGNTKEAVGGIELLEDAEPDDGVLEVGIITADGPIQWIRTAARALVGNAEDSPFTRTAQGASVVLTFDRPVVYEVDGGEREPVERLEIDVHEQSLTVCVPKG